MQKRTATSVGVVGLLATAFAASWMATSQNSPTGPENTTNDGSEVVYLGSTGMVFQSRSNDCGVAALMMVFDHYGMKPSEQDLRQRTELEFRGASLLKLKELAKSTGLKAEWWRLSFEDLARIQFPAILFIEDHHFIVFDSIDGRGILFVRDPAVGRLKIPRRRAIDIWKGETLVITRESR